MMKSNLKLLILLLVLVTGTYFLVERPDRVWWSQHNDSYTLKPIFENAKTLEFQKTIWVLKDQQWTYEKDILSQPILAKWKRILTSFKLEREIPLTATVKKADFITKGYSLGIDDNHYIIGDQSADGKSVYILDTDKNRILQMSLLPSDLYKVLDELKENDLEKMIEKRVYAHFSHIEFEKVLFETPGILSFELDLINKVTIPKPIAGVLQHPHLDQKFWHEMELLQFTHQLPYNPGLLYQKMAQVSFLQKDKKVLSFELHRLGPQNADAVVYVPETKQIFKVQGQTAKVFFDQVQDYWDRKIIPKNVFKAFNELNAHFVLGDKETNLKVINQEPLGFQSVDGKFKLKDDKLQNLFGIIFNLGQYEEASRVSILSKAESQQFQNESHIRLNVFGQDIMLVRRTNELVVVNFTQGFKAHFILFDISIGDQWEDFFTS